MKVKGKIINGLGRAARLGFPTFNIVLPDSVESGVYTGQVHYVGYTYKAVVFADTRRNILESHLLDFEIDEREPEIEVEIVEKIRDSMSFPHDGELIEQIKKDVEAVRNI